jgi:hypothetical protein
MAITSRPPIALSRSREPCYPLRMADPTHIAYGKHYLTPKIFEWLEIGMGRWDAATGEFHAMPNRGILGIHEVHPLHAYRQRPAARRTRAARPRQRTRRGIKRMSLIDDDEDRRRLEREEQIRRDHEFARQAMEAHRLMFDVTSGTILVTTKARRYRFTICQL